MFENKYFVVMENSCQNCDLNLSKIIGFSGNIYSGLLTHNDQDHIIFSLGCTIIVENILTAEQHFLNESPNMISCLSLSNDGQFIAAGNETHMGFKSDIYIWNYHALSLHCHLSLHKVKTCSLSFTSDNKYLVSLGGQDDGSVVVWSVERREAICGSLAQPMSSGHTNILCCSLNDPSVFVTGGNGTLRIWSFNPDKRIITPTDISLGQNRRSIISMTMSQSKNKVFCGTTTGDVLVVDLDNKVFCGIFPPKNKFSLGVTALKFLKDGNIIVGSGEGKLIELEPKNNSFSKKRQLELSKSITSISTRGSGHQIYIGCSDGHIYRLNYSSFDCELLSTTHQNSINDILFAPYCSDLFVTCSMETIRVWLTNSNTELLRIVVPNMTCSCLSISYSGNCIFGGFNDGRIRGFYPKSGKVIFTIDNAHSQGVTAMAVMADEKRMITGGGEGQLRVWHITASFQNLLVTLKEHKASVTCIKIRSDDKEAISSSLDGTCIVWDLERFARRQIIFATTLFHCLSYDVDEVQIIASGTDRQIGYWELYDGSLIRQVTGSHSGTINGIDISSCGKYFVTAGDDRLVKLWSYDRGTVLFVGKGHGSSILKVKICPNSQHIISVASDGSIFKWSFPSDLLEVKKSSPVASNVDNSMNGEKNGDSQEDSPLEDVPPCTENEVPEIPLAD